MSENISAAISVNGEIVMKQPLIKSMRVVKKETLKLISDWVSRTGDHQMVNSFALKFSSLFCSTSVQCTLTEIFLARSSKILYHHYWMPSC